MNSYTAPSESVDEWYKHFKKLADTTVETNINGIFVLEKRRARNSDKSSDKPSIEVVTPAANTEKIAESDLKNQNTQPTDIQPVSHFPEELKETVKTVSRKRSPVKKPTKGLKRKKTAWEKYL